MENIINSILEIESDASHKLDEATKKKGSVIAEAKTEAEKIAVTKKYEATKILDDFEKKEKYFADEKIQKIVAEKNASIDRLNKIYKENHISWETEILDRIVGE
ncbi:MAG: hypothetical protein RR540_04750 [Oscillospiraceae bacterium]